MKKVQTLSIGVIQTSNLQIEAPAKDTVCVLTALGDFNADGRIDFAVSAMDLGSGASNTSDLRLLLALGNGTFVDGTHLLGATRPSYQGASLLGADLNWDGYTDLVIARSGGDPDTTDGVYGDTQLVYLSDGRGSFHAIESPTTAYAHNGIVADVNGDSRADAFFFATVEGPSVLMLNQTQSNGGLAFTFDGLPHQAINTSGGDVWTVLERYPSGALKKMQGWHQHNTAFNDVDRDGDLDMVMFFGSGSNEVLVYKNDGSSTPSFDFAAPISVDAKIPGIPSAGNYLYGIINTDGSWAGLRTTGKGANYYETTQFDVDGDGYEDIVALASSNNYDYTTLNGESYFDATDAPGTDRYNHGTFFAVFTNNGIGLSNETATRIEQPDLKLINPNYAGHTGYIFNLVSVDLNGDGHLDFLCNNNMNQPFGQINGLEESDTVFMLNDGEGNFSQVAIEGLDWNQFDPLPIDGKLGFVSTIIPTSTDWWTPGNPPRPDFKFYFFKTDIPWTLGDSGDNFVYGTAANDQVDGSAGIDTFIALGRREEFAVFAQSSDIELQDNMGLTGVDRIVNVERLKFYDQKLAFDLNDGAGNAARILTTVFGGATVSNPALVGIALSFFDQGMSMEQVSELALFYALGEAPSSEAVVRLLWGNVIGSEIDSESLAAYSGLIDSGQMSAAQLTAFAASTDVTAELVNLTGLAQTGLAYI